MIGNQISLDEMRNSAAIRVQSLFRRHMAYKSMLEMCQKIVEPVYDTTYERHFYYNHKTKTSSWKCPSFLQSEKQESLFSKKVKDLNILLQEKENEIKKFQQHSNEKVRYNTSNIFAYNMTKY